MVSSAIEVLSMELEAVSEWLVENRLLLHLAKTESILFGPKRQLAYKLK